jgi:hypothetical protein
MFILIAVKVRYKQSKGIRSFIARLRQAQTDSFLYGKYDSKIIDSAFINPGWLYYCKSNLIIIILSV